MDCVFTVKSVHKLLLMLKVIVIETALLVVLLLMHTTCGVLLHITTEVGRMPRVVFNIRKLLLHVVAVYLAIQIVHFVFLDEEGLLDFRSFFKRVKFKI